MRVLVTGHHGYIGSVLAPMLQDAGHDVVGLDTFFYRGCDFGEAEELSPALARDVRDVTPSELEGRTRSTATERLRWRALPRPPAWSGSSSRPPAACTEPSTATRPSTRTQLSDR